MKKRLLFIALILIIAVSGAIAQKRPIDAGDYYKFKRVSGPSLSPDGKRIAFTVTTNREKENDRFSRIWMVDLNDGDPYPFTTPDRSSNNPSWSDDGNFLIFNSDRGVKNRTWHVNLKKGGEAFEKEDYKTGNRSHDENSKLFTKKVGEKPKAEKKKKDKFDGYIIEHRAYKRNGRGFVPAMEDRGGITQIFTTTWEASGDTLQLTFDDTDKSQAAWSYNDKTVVYSAMPVQKDSKGNELLFLDRHWKNEVFAVSASGGTPRKLNIPEGSSSGFQFANKTNKFFFNYRSDRNGPSAAYIYDLSKDTMTQIASDWIYGIRRVDWTPDDKKLYFSAQIGGSTHLCKVTTDGSGKAEQVTKGFFQYGGFQFNEKMTKMVYTKTSNVMPPELFTADINGLNERQLSFVNSEWLDEVYMAPISRHVIEGIGGLQIEGWLVEPYNYEKGKKYPMVLQIHGGPHSRYGDTFFHQFQVLSGRGMYVLYTNPRGSGGYGYDFTYITREKWGVDDYDDLMRFTDFAIENADIDPNRLGVAGGSYGGFMTNWITTKTNRFHAAASSRTIVNWWSFFGTSDAQGLIVNEFGFGLPWDKKVGDNMVKFSPISYVQNVKTPTLIIQSEEDHRTPIADAEQWYQALKILGVDARFVRYPRENHNLSRTGEPNHLVHRLNEITNWFDLYLNDTVVKGNYNSIYNGKNYR